MILAIAMEPNATTISKLGTKNKIALADVIKIEIEMQLSEKILRVSQGQQEWTIQILEVRSKVAHSRLGYKT
jgi:hypothetical protein